MLKLFFFKNLASFLRMYIIYSPLERGKFSIWKYLFRRYLSDKGITATATAIFGAKFKVTLSDLVQSSIYVFGAWEPVMTAYLMRILKKGDIFIDIGANIGYYSAMSALLVGDIGKTFAIEASPSIYEMLQYTISRNNINHVKTFNVAVTDRPCQVPIYIANNRNIGQSTIVDTMIGAAGGKFESQVNGLPLDQIIPVEDIINARIIKIDVEGAEWLVLQGMKHLLPKLSAHTEIFIEASVISLRSFGIDMDEFLKLFTDSGFSPFVVNKQFNEPYYPLQNAEHAITPLRDELSRYDLIDLLFRKTCPGGA